MKWFAFLMAMFMTMALGLAFGGAVAPVHQGDAEGHTPRYFGPKEWLQKNQSKRAGAISCWHFEPGETYNNWVVEKPLMICLVPVTSPLGV